MTPDNKHQWGPDFLTSYWKSTADGKLLAGDILAADIANDFGTPVFVYDRDIVDRKYSSLRHALPERFTISYSVKANPNPKLLRFFLDRGLGLEVASGGEFQLAKSAGCSAKDILFAGPGKTETELQLAIRGEIGEIHAESELEIERISRVSAALGKITTVALRVNPTEDGQGGAMRMGGKSAPFGVDEEQMGPLLHRIASDPHLQFGGIHLFVGTQILDSKLLLVQYKKGLEVAKSAARIADSTLHRVDFGGGLGIPYFAGETELDLNQLRDGLNELMDSMKREPDFAHTNFTLEPGRFLVGESGLYVTRINDIKISRGKKFLILDGGMNHHLAASGNLGQVIKRNFPMTILNKLNEPAIETVDVVGPLCTPLDTLGRAVQLPKADVGDLLGIFQAGAYARTASPLGFLSHSTPPEVWVENGQSFLIRRRGTPEDFWRDVENVNSPLELVP